MNGKPFQIVQIANEMHKQNIKRDREKCCNNREHVETNNHAKKKKTELLCHWM